LSFFNFRSLDSKRRRFTKGDILQRLKTCGDYFKELSEEICSELLPPDWDKDNKTSAKIKKLVSAVDAVRSRLHRLHEAKKKGQL
jgi:hypothetical protein